jgi:hypothetical protein
MSDIAMGESRYEDLNICWIDRTISFLPTLAEGGLTVPVASLVGT